MDGYFPIFFIDKDWILDWETPETIQIADDYLAVGIKGFLFDNKTGEVESSVAIPQMPFFNETLA